MIQMRYNVFETNSSSSHSLVMLKENKPLQQFIDPYWRLNDKGLLHFWDYDLEFGRAPFRILTDWYNRLCYVLASYANNEDTRERVEEICYSRIMGFNGFEFPKNWDDGINYGYVDHQSFGLLDYFLSKNSISLEEFIFNDRYIVIIDGDEYNIFDTIRGLPTWNNDAVEKIVGVYDDDTN